MHWRDFVLRVRALVGRRRAEVELDEELQFHVAMQARKLVASGLSPEDARRRAMRQFGGLGRIKDECRDERGLNVFENLMQDVRHACRLLVRRPGLTTAVGLTLGAGVGVTAAIFSLIYAVLLRPLPYPNPDELVRLYSVNERNPAQRGGLSVPELEAILSRTSTWSGLAVYTMFDTNLAGDGPAQSVKIAWSTPGLFELTGVRPMLGRTFEPADDQPGGENNKVVLSHHIWRDRFASDPGIIGRQVRMRLLSYTVIGVMPPGYRFPSVADVWAPIQSYMNKFDSRPRLDWTWRWSAIARLRPGVSLERAQADLRTIGMQISRERPESNRDIGYAALPLRTVEVGELRPYLVLLGIAVGCVLLVACANIASLLLTQALGRTREFVLRAAIGAGRGRVVAQLVTESVVLALVGGVFGLVLAVAATRALVALVPVDLPAWITIEINWPVLLFGLGVTVATGLLFGLAPAFEAARSDLQTALRPSAGGSARTGVLRRALIVAEVALSCVLLVVSGLMLKGFLVLYTSPPGFISDHLLTAFISPHRVGTNTELVEAYSRIYSRALEQLSATPGIVAAAGATSIPYSLEDNERPRARLRIRRQGESGEPLQVPAWTVQVSPRYFEAMGIPLLAGRDFTDADTLGRECVAVISARAASTIWGNRPALGEVAQFAWGGGTPPWCRVVGIVGNVRFRGSEDEQGIEVYWCTGSKRRGRSTWSHELRAIPSATPARCARPWPRATARRA